MNKGVCVCVCVGALALIQAKPRILAGIQSPHREKGIPCKQWMIGKGTMYEWRSIAAVQQGAVVVGGYLSCCSGYLCNG